MREKFLLEYEDLENNEQRQKYKIISQSEFREKLIFGIVTANQVGYIPNVNVSFTEDEENFNRDTYVFKSLMPIKKTDRFL